MKIKIEKEDRVWSTLVRSRDGRCRKCGKSYPYKLDAHHIMPRSRSSTRYLVKNGLTLCKHCHTLGKNSVHRIGKQFVIDIIGQKEYDQIDRLSNDYMSRDEAKQIFWKSYPHFKLTMPTARL